VDRYLNLYLDRERAIGPKGSIIRLMRMLLFVHILIVSFQIPFRAIVLDTTYIRDILPFTIVFLLLGLVAISGSFGIKRSYSLLEKLFFGYLLLGMLLVIFWLLEGIHVVDAFRVFRNHFFPVILFFIAKKTLASSYYRTTIVNIFFIIALTLLLMSLVEYILIKIIGYSPYVFPWNRDVFMTSERYIGNEGGGGYILPESSPILGLLGWPHATAATLMSLIAFCYPYIIKTTTNFTQSLSWIVRCPNWIGYSILVLTGVAIFFIFGVKMHMVTYIFVLLLLPFFTKGKNLRKNIIIALFLFIIVLNNNTFQSIIISKTIEGLEEINVNQASTLYSLIPANPVADLVNRPIVNIFLGNWNYYYTGEIRLLTYTANLGLVWFFLFAGIFIVGFFYARKVISNRFVKPFDRLFAIGTIGLLSVCFLDMGHYARVMTWPMIDMLMVCLGGLVVIYDNHSKIKRRLQVL